MHGPFPAKVINNLDAKKKGRVQIKIEHFHYGVAPTELPWAYQGSLSSGGSNLHGRSDIPEINSFVWVWFEDVDEFLRHPYYMADIQFSNLHPHNLFELNVKVPLLSASMYPNTKYTYYPNGICIGVDSSPTNPEIFFYHPFASFFIDKLGNLTIKSFTVNLMGGGGLIPPQPSLLGTFTYNLLNSLLTAIAAITVTDPQTSAQLPINNAATFTSLQTNVLPTILSLLTKNN